MDSVPGEHYFKKLEQEGQGGTESIGFQIDEQWRNDSERLSEILDDIFLDLHAHEV